MGRRKKEPRWNVYVSDSQGLRRLEGQEKEEFLGIDTQQASCSEECQPEYDDHWAGYYVASMEEHEIPAEVKLRANILSNQRRAWISPDGRETHFKQQACDMETGDLIKGKYTFVGVRMIQYANEQCEFSWCSCPDCSRGCHGIANCFQMSDFPALESHQHKGGIAVHCAIFEVAVEVAREGVPSPLELDTSFAEDLEPEVGALS